MDPLVRWSQEETGMLLGWLDFCRNTQKDFRETIVKHLASINPIYKVLPSKKAIKRVEDKLIILVRREKGLQNVLQLYSKGSTCLKTVSRELRTEIENRYAQYCREDQSGHQTVSQHATSAKFPSSTANNAGYPMRTPQKRNTIEQTSAAPPTTVLDSPMPAATKSLLSSSRRNSKETSRIREQWFLETHELRQDLAKEKLATAELRTKITHLELAKEKRQEESRNYEESNMLGLFQELAKQNVRIAEMQKGVNFTFKTNEHQPTTAKSNIVTALLNKMGDELEHIFYDDEFQRAPALPTKYESGDLNALIGSVFEQPEGLQQRRVFQRCIDKFAPEIWVRTFALAAAREWVFATDFPNFTPQDTRLLHAWASTILTHDGRNSLQNLDLVAHNHLVLELLAGSNIQELAQNMARRLSAALAPIFIDVPDTYSNAVETWGQSPQICFKAMFDAALRVKAHTVLTDRVYEFLVHPPGTMRATQKPRHNSAAGNSDTAQTWLLASLQVRAPRRFSSLRDPLKDALIQSKNFVRHASDDEPQELAEIIDVIVQKYDSTVPQDRQANRS